MTFFKGTNWLYALLFGIVLLVYANTLRHDFVLDDEVVIVKNQFVNQGINGIGSIFSEDSFAGYSRVGEGQEVVEGGRYRPLSIALFAIIYSLFGFNPVVYHLLAIMIFAMTCLMLYRVLLIMLKDRSYHIEIAWLTTLLFMVHPIHTEVVANIKGCDEQLALFFGLAALFAVFKWWDQKGIHWMIFTGVFLLLACLAKENAIMLVFIIPLAILFFRQAGLKDLFRYAAPGFIAAGLFMIIRFAVLEDEHAISRADDPLNNPFLIWNGESWAPASASSKVATVLYTFGQYVRLMILPYPLTHDYYPFHISLQSFSNPFVLISLVLLIFFLMYGVLSIRRKGIAGFGILYFLITLSIISNVFFQVGTFMAERFLFIPSLGLILSIVVLLVHLHRDKKINYLPVLLYGIAILFAILTIMRNQAWKNNETLFEADARTSSGSVKQQNDHGTVLLMKAMQSNTEDRQQLLEEAYGHLKYAIEHHPTYYDAFLAFGATAFYLQKYDESVAAYKRAFELYPQDPMSKTGLLYALQGLGVHTGSAGKAHEAIPIFMEAWELQPDTTSAIELSKYYMVLEQPEKSIEWLARASMLVPSDAKLKYRLATAYQAAGHAEKADSVYQQARTSDPDLPPLNK